MEENRGITQIVEDIFGEANYDTDNIDKSIRHYKRDLLALNRALRGIQKQGNYINQQQAKHRLEIERLQTLNAHLVEEEKENAQEAKELDEVRKKINETIAQLEEIKAAASTQTAE